MEMTRKMAGRRLIRLSQLQEKVASEKLEDIDWVTFGVILNKITPQSCNSVSLFLRPRLVYSILTAFHSALLGVGCQGTWWALSLLEEENGEQSEFRSGEA